MHKEGYRASSRATPFCHLCKFLYRRGKANTNAFCQRRQRRHGAFCSASQREHDGGDRTISCRPEGARPAAAYGPQRNGRTRARPLASSKGRAPALHHGPWVLTARPPSSDAAHNRCSCFNFLRIKAICSIPMNCHFFHSVMASYLLRGCSFVFQ
jgi:hypothetical protein